MNSAKPHRIDRAFPEFDSCVRDKLKELTRKLRKKPTDEELDGWKDALNDCANDSERIRMIEYSTGENTQERVYRQLYPERGKSRKPKRGKNKKQLPDWYDTVPTEPASKEAVREARELREKISGGKQ